jgi:hypothetical protein
VGNIHSPRLLQPLTIPKGSWIDISMDFIEGLSLSLGKSVIWVIVDRLTMYGHFLNLAHPFTAIIVANLFFEQISWLYGLSQTIVSNMDNVFTSSLGMSYLNFKVPH